LTRSEQSCAHNQQYKENNGILPKVETQAMQGHCRERSQKHREAGDVGNPPADEILDGRCGERGGQDGY
jgi:hypothetical protein